MEMFDCIVCLLNIAPVYMFDQCVGSSYLPPKM